MIWKTPPILKVYEAIGSIADNRIEIDGNTAKVQSSSKGKYYSVVYDPKKKSIVANDNASYYQGYMGYTIIAFLLLAEVVPFDKSLLRFLKDIQWKDMNTRVKNNKEKALEEVNQIITDRAGNTEKIAEQISDILKKITALKLEKGWMNEKPPTGY